MSHPLISFRPDKRLFDEFVLLRKEEGWDSSEASRRIFNAGVFQLKKERALARLREGKVSLWKAAEEAGLSLYEMMDLAKRLEVAFVSISDDDIDSQLRLARRM